MRLLGDVIEERYGSPSSMPMTLTNPEIVYRISLVQWFRAKIRKR